MRRVGASHFIAALGLALIGCASGPERQAASHLAVRAVDWNPSRAEVGRVTAVADRGTEVAVFADGAASVFDTGSLITVDHSVTRWLGAATLPAADGNGAWLVGIDASGHVRRLRGRSGFEDVSSRWGLESTRVLGARALGDRGAAFLLSSSELAIADGSHVSRFGSAPLLDLVAGGGVVAGLGHERVIRFAGKELASTLTTRAYELPGATALAVDEAGKIHAATPDALYVENERGELALRFRANRAMIRDLVSSHGRVWFVEGSELATIERGKVAATSGAKLTADTRLWPSTSGDVWLVSKGKLSRFARDDGRPVSPAPIEAARQMWSAHVQPIFTRACAKCHGPSGAAGIDLSTFQAWRAKKYEIRERVIEERSMPPYDQPFDEADRAAIRNWLDGVGW